MLQIDLAICTVDKQVLVGILLLPQQIIIANRLLLLISLPISRVITSFKHFAVFPQPSQPLLSCNMVSFPWLSSFEALHDLRPHQCLYQIFLFAFLRHLFQWLFDDVRCFFEHLASRLWFWIQCFEIGAFLVILLKLRLFGGAWTLLQPF